MMGVQSSGESFGVASHGNRGRRRDYLKGMGAYIKGIHALGSVRHMTVNTGGNIWIVHTVASVGLRIDKIVVATGTQFISGKPDLMLILKIMRPMTGHTTDLCCSVFAEQCVIILLMVTSTVAIGSVRTIRPKVFRRSRLKVKIIQSIAYAKTALQNVTVGKMILPGRYTMRIYTPATTMTRATEFESLHKLQPSGISENISTHNGTMAGFTGQALLYEAAVHIGPGSSLGIKQRCVASSAFFSS